MALGKKSPRKAKVKAETSGNTSASIVGFEQKLWQAADKMRNNMEQAVEAMTLNDLKSEFSHVYVPAVVHAVQENHTVDGDGLTDVSNSLDGAGFGLQQPFRLGGLTDGHRAYLLWHARMFNHLHHEVAG